MEAYIRYLAVNTEQPEVMADYYKHHFGMHEADRSPGGDIALSDGWFKVVFLSHWAQGEIAGLSHYGIAIDDLDELRSRLMRFQGNAQIEPDQGGAFHGEYFVRDPQGMRWSISLKNFGLAGRPVGTASVPRIRHAELSVGDTHREMEWMRDVFGLREVNTSLKIRQAGSKFAIRMLGEGVVNVTFLPFDRIHPKRMSEEQTQKKWAVQHFGWVVPDIEGLMKRLPEGMADWSEMTGNMAERQAVDPDGNRFDLSQSLGFEVDFDVWERGHGKGGPPASIRMPPG
jgi:catechol 2,3-dioxygenase-like lactoylglutathione lyase family enzyme